MRILPNILAVYITSCTFSGCGDSKPPPHSNKISTARKPHTIPADEPPADTPPEQPDSSDDPLPRKPAEIPDPSFPIAGSPDVEETLSDTSIPIIEVGGPVNGGSGGPRLTSSTGDGSLSSRKPTAAKVGITPNGGDRERKPRESNPESSEYFDDHFAEDPVTPHAPKGIIFSPDPHAGGRFTPPAQRLPVGRESVADARELITPPAEGPANGRKSSTDPHAWEPITPPADSPTKGREFSPPAFIPKRPDYRQIFEFLSRHPPASSELAQMGGETAAEPRHTPGPVAGDPDRNPFSSSPSRGGPRIAKAGAPSRLAEPVVVDLGNKQPLFPLAPEALSSVGVSSLPPARFQSSPREYGFASPPVIPTNASSVRKSFGAVNQSVSTMPGHMSAHADASSGPKSEPRGDMGVMNPPVTQNGDRVLSPRPIGLSPVVPVDNRMSSQPLLPASPPMNLPLRPLTDFGSDHISAVPTTVTASKGSSKGGLLPPPVIGATNGGHVRFGSSPNEYGVASSAVAPMIPTERFGGMNRFPDHFSALRSEESDSSSTDDTPMPNADNDRAPRLALFPIHPTAEESSRPVGRRSIEGAHQETSRAIFAPSPVATEASLFPGSIFRPVPAEVATSARGMELIPPIPNSRDLIAPENFGSVVSPSKVLVTPFGHPTRAAIRGSIHEATRSPALPDIAPISPRSFTGSRAIPVPPPVRATNPFDNRLFTIPEGADGGTEGDIGRAFLRRTPTTHMNSKTSDPSPHSSPEIAQVKYPLVKNFQLDIQASGSAKRALLVAYGRDNEFSQCPREYSLAVGGGPPLRQADAPLAKGSGSSLFQLGDRYLVKLITSFPSQVVDGFIVERRIMRSMMAEQPGGAAKYGIASIYDLKPNPPMTEVCQVRMLVTDLIPGTSLMARVSESPPLDTRSILLIAVNALEAVRKFHNSGFAHGDIHWGNIMVHGTSARLIDLGRANPFANEDGSYMPIQQKPDRLAPADDTLNIGFLSPWHIESNLGSKYLSSRRDDVFRLAEMFCRVSSDAFRSDILLRTMVANLLGFGLSDFKRQVAGRPTWHEIPRPAMAFYTYTLTLGFDEEPDYAIWIAEFNEAAKK
jgi:hypothetical protein